MKRLTVKSPAKINLTFDILGRRADGYHDIETVFQSIDLADRLSFEIKASNSTQINVHCRNPHQQKLLPPSQDNLIAKAGRVFLLKLDKGCFDIDVHLEKHIPVSAGLAGGSSNAAATFFALNEYFDRPFSQTTLMEMGLEIGSDVPFCLMGGTAVGRGRGEVLTPIKRILELTLCVVKPRKLSVSTPWAYQEFDRNAAASTIGGNGSSPKAVSTAPVRLLHGKVIKPKLEQAQKGLSEGDMELAVSGFGNVFEPIVFSEYPELAALKELLTDMGAWYCQMSGSGPTLFALVAGIEMAHHMRRTLLNDDELGFYYGTNEVIEEEQPPLDFRIAEACDYGVSLE